MELKHHSPAALYPAAGPYAHAVEVSGADRLLFVSGTMGLTPDGVAPGDFETQCEQAWRNIGAILDGAGLSLRHLVKVTCFLSHPGQRAANAAIRERVLGDHKVAVTVVGATLLESDWLLEIEAIAAA